MHQLLFSPFFASGALKFAFEKATTEGKLTICALGLVSFVSWTVIFSKARQLYRANKAERLNHVSQVVAELPFATSLEISDDSVTVGWNHERDDLAAFLVIRREGWTIGKATFRASGDPVVRPYD